MGDERIRRLGAALSPAFGAACETLLPWDDAHEPPFGAMLCVLGPGQATDPDEHAQDEVVLVLEGSIVARTGAVDHELDAGGAILVDRDVRHVLRNRSDHREARVLCLWWPLREAPRE